MACSVLQSMRVICILFFLCNSLLLWNPAIGEVRQIPRTRTVKLGEWDCSVGFGFSAIVNDYKIVKAYGKFAGVISGVEVYSLSTGSWKEIEFGPLEGVRIFGDTVTANGSIFWSVLMSGVEEEDDDVDTEWGVSFDIATEVFTLIPFPCLYDGLCCKLSVYEDKLAVISLSGIGNFPNYLYCLIDLWVLEEGIGSSRERWSWTKKYTCNTCPSMLSYPVTIWRNGIVCGSIFTNEIGREMETGEERVGLYLINMVTNECKMFAVPGFRLGGGFNYVESLVPVGNIQFEAP
ncbi:F-box/kelch-repeat protein At3g06240 [Neltuma alba]|uniref:F-box/kelch-repeat protein At3g06240 n=1 Tax=Neltuma alba TaxID=207710 RepID=UPI0010A33B2D|nr:F-box/kelch-repeat protein At3g06240-like [Prosopis alba]